jgi:hypothetical protein
MNISDFMAAEYRNPGSESAGRCCYMVDRWLQAARGLSPMAAHGWAGVSRERVQETNVARAVARALYRSGLTATDDPKPGDIGIIVYMGRVCAALHDGQHWVSYDDDGFIAAPLFSYRRAWAV